MSPNFALQFSATSITQLFVVALRNCDQPAGDAREGVGVMYSRHKRQENSTYHTAPPAAIGNVHSICASAARPGF